MARGQDFAVVWFERVWTSVERCVWQWLKSQAWFASKRPSWWYDTCKASKQFEFSTQRLIERSSQRFAKTYANILCLYWKVNLFMPYCSTAMCTVRDAMQTWLFFSDTSRSQPQGVQEEMREAFRYCFGSATNSTRTVSSSMSTNHDQPRNVPARPSGICWRSGSATRCKSATARTVRVDALWFLRLTWCCMTITRLPQCVKLLLCAGKTMSVVFVLKGKVGGMIKTMEIPAYPVYHVYTVQRNAWMNAV